MLSLLLALGVIPANVYAAGVQGEPQTTALEGSGTEAEPYQIGSAEDLLALGGQTCSGFYELTADLDMEGQTMSPIRSLTGSFDGNGHTIRGLTLQGSGNVALIGDLKGGSIQSLTLAGVSVTATGDYSAALAARISGVSEISDCAVTEVTVTSSGSYVGALVGQIYANTEISTCLAEGNVKSTRSSYTYVGGLIGDISGYSSADISLSYADVQVEAAGTYVGGLIGRVNYARVNVSDSYATGDVTTTSTSSYVYSGGVAGYLYLNSSYLCTFINCYYGGTLTNQTTSTSYTDAFLYTTSTSYVTLENCYYDREKLTFEKDSRAEGKTTEEMQAADFATALGGAFEAGEGRSPILKWQNPNAVFGITLQVEPKDAKVIFDGTEQEVNEEGIYTFAGLQAKSSHTYRVFQAEEAMTDLKEESGTINLGKTDLTKKVTLVPNKYDLIFTVEPKDADFSVKDAEENVLEPKDSTDGVYTYQVPNGAYTCKGTRFGFEDFEKTVTVNRQNCSENITLTEKPKQEVTFVLKYQGAVIPADGFFYEVACGENQAEVTEGKASLYEGCSYAYTITSRGYKKAAGTVTSESGTVTIELEEKTAWEGAGDLYEPESRDGVYQITDGGELAWFAALVNGTLEGVEQNVNAKAVLVRDIDLGGEVWTPISTGYPYFGGTLDGNGKTIRNLCTGEGANYQGLFGYVGSEGTVSNLTIEGTVKGRQYVGAAAGNNKGTIAHVVNKADVSATGECVGGITGTNEGVLLSVENQGDLNSTYYNLGGIAGRNTGTITEALNVGSVTSGYSTTSTYYGVGGIVGYDNNTRSGVMSISQSRNRGAVSAPGMTVVGGIAGYVSGSAISHVYNTGAVHGKAQVGGLIGRGSGGKLSYAYNAGTVTKPGTSSYDYIGEIAGYAYNVGSEELYYDASNQAGNGVGGSVSGSSTLTAEDGVNHMIGKGDFIADSQNLNGGFPILAFEDQTEKFEVQVTVTPADAELVVFNEEGQSMAATSGENGVYLYSLPEGTYTYEAERFGKVTETGSFQVAGEGLEKAITLADAALYDVTFRIAPQESKPNITLRWRQQVIEPGEDGVYHLPAGAYEYTVKAKGYAKEAGTLEVTEEAQTIMLTLSETQGWDGETLEQPVMENGVYQISSGEELAWFAALVNGTLTDGTAQEKGADAVLTDDIDLGSGEWTPIGNGYSNSYTGTFDGQHFTVQNLKITAEGDYKALFGYVTAATIQNLVLTGEVSGNANAVGGLVAKGSGKFTIRNCGSQVDVANDSAYGYSAGIVARGDSDGVIEGCYNAGSVTSSGYGSGITADMSYGVIQNCYNAGSISANRAGGIAGSSSNTYNQCYNIGTIEGTASAYSICGSNYAEYGKTYYLVGSAAGDDASHGTSMTADEMRAAAFVETLGAENWQADSTGLTNGGYPVLFWQKIVQPEIKKVKLETPENLQWVYEEAGPNATEGTLSVMPLAEEGDDNITVEPGSENRNCTAGVTWSVVTGAVDYTVKLYRYQDYHESENNKETPQPVYTAEHVAGTTYSFAEVFDKMDTSMDGLYMFTVTAIGDGDFYLDSDESELDGGGYSYYGALHIRMPSNLKWTESTRTAVWDNVEKAEFYLLTLYKGEEIVSESLLEEYDREADTVSQAFLREIETTGDYSFSVRAGYVVADESSRERGNIILSDVAKSASFHFVSTEPEWVDIISASQWIELANVTARGTEYDKDADAQYAAWSKNYRLADDLDFSDLTAEEEAKTKSLGNAEAEFTGIFDGNGHKITGLTLSNGDAGLFAFIGKKGVVRNVVIDSANVLFSDNAAALCWMNKGTITECAVLNTNITADQGAVIGGMVSRNYGTITKSYVLGGSLAANSSTANGHAGFVGGNYGTIRQCYTTMDVRTKSYCAGGFAGWADTSGEEACVFEDCFALGDVSAENGWSGGFVGRVNSSEVQFTNCYAANAVTSEKKPERAHGFTGALGSEAYNEILETEGGFEITLTQENFTNCFYNRDLTAQENEGSFADAKTSDEMKRREFAEALGSLWTQDEEKNGGLPYLRELPAPVKVGTNQMTVELLVAVYDTGSYQYQADTEVIPVTLESTGNTRVLDVLQAAEEQELITYTYTVTAAFGSFVESINGHALQSPDGWMFTINDKLSNLSASLATVKDGDQILWYEGRTQNQFRAPSWASLTGGAAVDDSILITSADQLLELSASTDDEVLAKKYKLGADIDLQGIEFSGIGSLAHPFAGTFDGDGYRVSNMTVAKEKESAGVGMFNYIKGASILNVNLTNAAVTGGSVVGLLVGNADVAVDGSDRTKSVSNLIGNCRAAGTVTALNDSNSGAYAGGLIGFNNGDTDPATGISAYSSVDRCSAEVTVNASSAYAGGLVGGNYGYITSSGALATVNGTSGVGGFAGGNNGEIYNCHADGRVSGESIVGGFAGLSTERIEDSYSLCEAASTKEDGERIGGFLGSGGGVVKNSVSAGTVDAPVSVSYVGGFAGYYTGTLSGLEKDIQMAGCFGNCVAADERILPAVGNKSTSTVEAEQKALEKMQLTDGEEISEKLKTMFGVQVKEHTREEMEAALEKIYERMAKEFVNDEMAPWVIADLTAYETAYGRERALSEEQIQSYVDDLVAKAVETSSAGDLAKYMISLKALGYDAQKIVTKNQKPGTYFDMAALLREMVENRVGGSDSIYTLPYILMALQQDSSYASEEVINGLIEQILAQQLPNGGFGYQSEGVDYADADTIAPVVLALAKYYETNSAVRAAVDGALDKELIRGLQGESGAVYSSWTNSASAESTGLILAAIASVGKDASDYRAGRKSLLDGLMEMLNPEKDGFLYNGETNAFATEQGFRGLFAALQAENQGFSMYDFSGKPANVVKVSGSSSGTEPGGETETPDTEINPPKDEEVKEITGVKAAYRKEAGAKAFRLDAKAGKAKLQYISSKPSVASVGKDSGIVKVKKIGKAVITITAAGEKGRTLTKKVTVTVVPKQQRIKSLKSTAKGSMTVKLRKDKKVTGYQIWYSASRKFKKAVKVNITGKSKVTKKFARKLKSGRKYYVKARSYKKIGRTKYFGGWSRVRKVKVK